MNTTKQQRYIPTYPHCGRLNPFITIGVRFQCLTMHIAHTHSTERTTLNRIYTRRVLSEVYLYCFMYVCIFVCSFNAVFVFFLHPYICRALYGIWIINAQLRIWICCTTLYFKSKLLFGYCYKVKQIFECNLEFSCVWNWVNPWILHIQFTSKIFRLYYFMSLFRFAIM